MKPRYPIPAGGAVILLVIVSTIGCSTAPQGADPAGAPYLLDAEPPAAQSVADVWARLDAAKTPADVVVVGRINGLGQPTWDSARAAFLIADLELADEVAAQPDEHDETPKHDAENCPFCRKKLKEELTGLALIEVVDPSGAVPARDARKLLGLRDDQVVVVRGQGEVDSLGSLVVRTTGIYVRP